jgi:hypothetical protein
MTQQYQRCLIAELFEERALFEQSVPL